MFEYSALQEQKEKSFLSIKRILFCTLVTLIVSVLIFFCIVWFSKLDVDRLDPTYQSPNLISQINDEGLLIQDYLVGKGSQIILEAQITSTLSFMTQLEWTVKGVRYPITEKNTLEIFILNFQDADVSCQAIYSLFGGKVRESNSKKFQLNQQNDTNYLFYSNDVILIPKICVESCLLNGSSTVIMDTSVNQVCRPILSIDYQTILVSNDTSLDCNLGGLQHRVTKYEIKGKIVTAWINTTSAEKLTNIITDANFKNTSLFQSLTLQNFEDQNQQFGNLQSLQVGDNNMIYRFDSGDRAFSPIQGVGVAFNLQGWITVNVGATMNVNQGNLTQYQITWNPQMYFEFAGVLNANLSASFEKDFNLFEAPFLGLTKIFGVLWEPTFALKMNVAFNANAAITVQVLGNATLSGSICIMFDALNQQWGNPQISDIGIKQKNIEITPLVSGGVCQSLLQIGVGPEIGLQFAQVFQIALSRLFQVGFQIDNPSSLQSPVGPLGQQDLGGPDPNPQSTAYCNKYGCWCPNCSPGSDIPSFSGAFFDFGWNLGLSVSFWWFSYSPDFLQKYWSTNYYPVGPQKCGERAAACSGIYPQRCSDTICPVRNLCSASDCYACPQPGQANCGNAADWSTENALWCQTTYENQGIPVSQPPICGGGNTCVVRCCSGSQWNQCYFSASSTSQFCN